LGIRIFVPIYPEINEFKQWQDFTNFKAVIIHYKDILQQKNHDKEKEVIHAFASLCAEHKIPFLDAFDDFNIRYLLQKIKEENLQNVKESAFPDSLSDEAEAVIFTTSRTSG